LAVRSVDEIDASFVFASTHMLPVVFSNWRPDVLNAGDSVNLVFYDELLPRDLT
jgi:hypothetical protein